MTAKTGVSTTIKNIEVTVDQTRLDSNTDYGPQILFTDLFTKIYTQTECAVVCTMVDPTSEATVNYSPNIVLSNTDDVINNGIGFITINHDPTTLF